VAKFFQLAPPDLTDLGLGTATFESMQALGFSADSSLLLVKISFTDDGEPTLLSKYATFVYDLADEKYIANLNDLLGPSANVTQVRDAYIIGNRASWEVVANVDILNSNAQVLKSYSSNGAITHNLITAEATDLAHLTPSSEIEVESFQLTDDGRYLAVQTSSNLLASDASDDVNQSSDIYLIDRNNGSVSRVSFQGGIGKDDAVYLADITVQGSQVKVAFVTDQYFSTKDRNSLDLDRNGSIESRNDLYLATSEIGADGTLLEFTFELLSVDGDGFAAGFVNKDSDSLPQITERGVYFSSGSFSLITGDNNDSTDVFISTDTGIQLIQLSGINELISGADFVGASQSGRTVYLKTSSPELSGSPDVDQIAKVSLTDSSYEVVSNNNVQADNIVINGSVAPMGGSLAFTSLASNLVSLDHTLGSEYDLYLYVDADDSMLIYGTENSDKLYSTPENEVFYGLEGSDQFIFEKNTLAHGSDQVVDFTKGEDEVILNGYQIGEVVKTLDADGYDLIKFPNQDEGKNQLVIENEPTQNEVLKIDHSQLTINFNKDVSVASNEDGDIEIDTSTSFNTVSLEGVTSFKTQIRTEGQSRASDPINLSDVLAQLKHIIGLKELKLNAKFAADTNNDGNVNLSDVLENLKHIIGLKTIDTFDLVSENGQQLNMLDENSRGNMTLVINGDADQSHAEWHIV
jgi:hypothetical protein